MSRTRIDPSLLNNLSSPLLGADGTVSLPGYSFSADTNSGLYRIGTDDIAIATNGIKQLEVSTTAVTTFLPTAIKGTTTNDSASAGQVGEYVSSSVNDVNITTTDTGQDITTISLTAGDWDVTGMIFFAQNGATWTEQLLYVATGEPGNSLTNSNNFNRMVMTNASSSTTPVRITLTVASVRVSIASTTTIQLKAKVKFSVGTPSANGASITARRVR